MCPWPPVPFSRVRPRWRGLRALARVPLVVAPMAGGPSTPDLVVAVARAGAFGFVAGGYRTADDVVSDMAAVRRSGVRAFGVNLFVPGAPTAEPERLAAYLHSLAAEAGALGAVVGDATWDDDDYASKVEALLAAPPPMVSFTFGVPDVEVVRAFHDAGVLVALTVTTPEEAARALRVAPDALALQGAEAGAHRGSLANDDRADADRSVRSLLASVGRRTSVPLIAAGGVGGPDDVVDLLAARCPLVQSGTAFLRCPESGAHAVAKDALADLSFTHTAVTRAFSGRRARALVNDMVRAHRDAPAAYPEINNATRPWRAAAAAAGTPGT